MLKTTIKNNDSPTLLSVLRERNRRSDVSSLLKGLGLEYWYIILNYSITKNSLKLLDFLSPLFCIE